MISWNHVNNPSHIHHLNRSRSHWHHTRSFHLSIHQFVRMKKSCFLWRYLSGLPQRHDLQPASDLSSGSCIPGPFISWFTCARNIIFVVKVAINSLATFCTVANFQSNLSTFWLASAWPWSESALAQTQWPSWRFWKIQTFVTNVTVTLVRTFFVDTSRIWWTFLI